MIINPLSVFFFILFVSACKKTKRPEQKPDYAECGTVTTFNEGATRKKNYEIEMMVDNRLNYFITQFSDEESFGIFYGKTIKP